MSTITPQAAKQLIGFGENWMVGAGMPAADVEAARRLMAETGRFKELVTALAVTALLPDAPGHRTEACRRTLEQLVVLRRRATPLMRAEYVDGAGLTACLQEMTHWLEEVMCGRGHDGAAMDGLADTYRRIRLLLRRCVPSELVAEGIPVFERNGS